MVYINNSGWEVVYDRRAEKDASRFADDVRASLQRIIEMIERYGLDQVHEPYIKHIRGKLWEMRAKGKDGIARAMYVTATGKKVVILHAFVKKTQQTPNEAIDLAMQRAKEHGLL